ncbi:hypothetical protein PO909_015878 [Leuciscus waleckii]
MESSLEMSAVTGSITAAITGLFPLKSKPVQAIIMSMSWLDRLTVILHTVQYSSKLSDTGSINTSPTTVTPVTISPGKVFYHFLSNTFKMFFTSANLSVDPCYKYTVLDDPWRANSSQTPNSYICDASVSWSGWYRLFINNMSAHIPDTCVARYSCGTDIPLWIRGGHPTVTDGVVTRDVCGNDRSYCCYYGSFPIKVKACPDNYYVYELIRPTVCYSAFCAGNYIHMSSFYCEFVGSLVLIISHYFPSCY